MRVRCTIRSKVVACLIFGALATGACRSPYRESVPPSSAGRFDGNAIAVAGVYDAYERRLDASASRRLADASGYPLTLSDLPAQEVDLLLADPGWFAIAAEGRRRVAHRIAQRRILVGVIRPLAVEGILEWGIAIPILSWWAFPLPTLRVPISRGSKVAVPHQAITIRLLDLESGTVEAEYFTIANRDRDRVDQMERSISSAMRIMRLGSAP